MKSKQLSLAVTASLLIAAPFMAAQSPSSPSLPPPRAGFSFPQKQTLTYAVDFRVVPAGTATLHFEVQGDEEHLTATAQTNGAISLIYKIDDHFQTSFNRLKGCTDEFDKNTQEGRRHLSSTMKIDYGRMRSIFDEKNLVDGKGKHEELAISGCVTDLLTGVYYASSQPMEVGKNFVIPVVDAMHVVPVTLKVEAREQIKTPLGIFKTVRVQPTADAGVVKNRGNIWIWYTDDDLHLPVQMRARSFWGTITFRLIGNENK